MKAISITERFPDDGKRVLIFDSTYSEWNVGWNAWRHQVGGTSRPGRWILPLGDGDDMNITHWAELPDNP